MAIFEFDRPIKTKEARIQVDNRMKPGIYRFQLIVTDNAGRQSQPIFQDVRIVDLNTPPIRPRGHMRKMRR